MKSIRVHSWFQVRPLDACLRHHMWARVSRAVEQAVVRASLPVRADPTVSPGRVPQASPPVRVGTKPSLLVATPMARWGIVIDLLKCVGCYACVISCKQEHFLPPGVFWNRVLISESGKYPTVRKLILPVMCNHCQEAPCVRACPSGATTQREDGIVTVDSDKCVGCRYCLIVCPYQQRTFHADGARGYFPGQGLTQHELLGRQIYPHETGTVVKCNFCAERIDEGLKKNLQPGVDREATPTCVITCPAKARYFGDLDDPFSEVSILIKTRKGHQLHPEFGTEPSVYYLEY